MPYPVPTLVVLVYVQGLLTYDPDKRLSARAALKHEYLKQRPVPKAVVSCLSVSICVYLCLSVCVDLSVSIYGCLSFVSIYERRASSVGEVAGRARESESERERERERKCEQMR